MKSYNIIIQLVSVIGIIFMVNIISNYFYGEIDLTDDKRYTLSASTKEIISTPDDNITITVLLEGDFPAGFKRLQSSVKEMISKFQSLNSNIVVAYENPSEGVPRVMEQRRKSLAEDKIIPINLSYSDGTQLVQKAVYPFAVITFNNRKQVVNLLEEQKPGDDEDEILNKSVALLEYKFANAFQKMIANRSKNILFTTSNGELAEDQVFRLATEMRKFNRVGRISLDTTVRIDTTIDLLIVAGPTTEFTLQNQFKIDQYVMNGGKIIWMIDKFDTSLDSINKYKFYIPPSIETNLDELLFKYGVRLMPDLIMDLECSAIPQVIGMAGDKPQTKLFPWYYHLSTASSSPHVIVKNIDRVNLFFPSTIDTLKADGNVKKTVLLKSSKYARSQLAPVRLSFEILKTEPDPSKFNDGNKAVAVLLEGVFESAFKNRVTPEFKSTLEQLNVKFEEKSIPTKQLLISDADFAKNLVNTSTGDTEDIGYNKWERRYYKGNKDFIFNAVEYMLNDESTLESRSKEIKLRLLDGVKTKQEKTKWQVINVVLPVVILALFGYLFVYLRRRKYGKPGF